MESASTIECPWRSRNAGHPLEITAARCVLTKSQPEFLVRCFKAGCKGTDEPKAKAAEAAPVEAPEAPAARAEVSKPEEPEATELPLCPCGCGRQVKRGNTYAGQGCSLRWRARRARTTAPEAAPATAEPAADHLNDAVENVPEAVPAAPAEEPTGSPVFGPGLCACGCGRPVEGRSKYADKRCSDRLYYLRHRDKILERTSQRRAHKKTGQGIESKGPKPLKVRKPLKEDARRHHSGGPTEMVEPPVPAPLPKQPKPVITGPVAVLLAERPALLRQLSVMAIEEERTLEGQTIWCLREYLAIHVEAVRLAAQEAAA